MLALRLCIAAERVYVTFKSLEIAPLKTVCWQFFIIRVVCFP